MRMVIVKLLSHFLQKYSYRGIGDPFYTTRIQSVGEPKRTFECAGKACKEYSYAKAVRRGQEFYLHHDQRGWRSSRMSED
jgi:hypothetical protein